VGKGVITAGIISAIFIASVSVYYVLKDQKISNCNNMLDQVNSNRENLEKELNLYQREWFPTPSYKQQIKDMQNDYDKQIAIYVL